MLTLSRDTKIPSIEDAQSILTYHTSRLGIPLDFDRLCEYTYYYMTEKHIKLERLLRYIAPTKSSYSDFKDTIMKDWLRSANISTGLLQTPGGGWSLSEESVNGAIRSGIYDAEKVAILQLYMEAKNDNGRYNTYKKLITDYPVCKMNTFDDHRMIIVRPTWVPQNTGRIGANNPGITNFPSTEKDIFTVPKGWILVEADSGQIEPRITQSWLLGDPVLKRCTMAYNDAYYGYVHYCTVLTQAERNNPNTQITPLEVTEDMKAKRKKFKTWGNAVMYGSTRNKDGDPDFDLFVKYIGQHPGRVKKMEEISNLLDQGKNIFYTPFGTPIDISKSEKLSGYMSAQDEHHEKQKLAINNPLQGAAADLFRYSVSKANDIIINSGCVNTVILKYVHDSGSFAVHENDYDKIGEQLAGVTAYQVDDWLPIYNDPHIGITQADSSVIPRLI